MAVPVPARPPADPPAPRDRGQLALVVMRPADLFGRARSARQESQATRARASALRAQLAARPTDAVRDRLRTARDRAANLERALQSNRRIGMAVGILMERHRVPEEAAFELLRTVSTRTNTKLRDVAERVVYTGSLPG